MNTAERIRFVRGELTQTAFAALLGVHKNSVGSYERGLTKPDIGFLQALCTAFAVEPRWMLFGEGPLYLQEASSVVPSSHAAHDASVRPWPPPDSPDPPPPAPCPQCAHLNVRLEDMERELRETNASLREVTNENRQLWRENGAFKEKLARFEERYFKPIAEATGGNVA